MKKIIFTLASLTLIAAPALAEFDPIAAHATEAEVVAPEIGTSEIENFDEFFEETQLEIPETEIEDIDLETLEAFEEVQSEIVETENLPEPPKKINLPQLENTKNAASAIPLTETKPLALPATNFEFSGEQKNYAENPTAIQKFLAETSVANFDYSSKPAAETIVTRDAPSFSYREYLSATPAVKTKTLPKTGAGIAIALLGSLTGAAIFQRKKCSKK